MYYEVNVSAHGQHWFATAPRSVTTEGHLRDIVREFVKAFPTARGYLVSVVRWETAEGQAIPIDSLLLPVHGTDTALTPNEKVLLGLRVWRQAVAKEQGIPPFWVLTQRTLTTLAAELPRTNAELFVTYGMGPVRTERYGTAILNIINDNLPDCQFCAFDGVTVTTHNPDAHSEMGGPPVL